MTNLGRFYVSASLLTALLALPCAAQAMPESDCRSRADLNYAIAVAIDYAGADMVHENTMADCQVDEFMGDAEFRAMMLARIAAEPDALRRRWQLEAFEFGQRCPNGYYDAANDVDVCE